MIGGRSEIMDNGGRDALAFSIRSSGRAKRASNSPAVIPARRYLKPVSPSEPTGTTPIKDVEPGSLFFQPPPPEGCLFLVILGVVAAAFGLGAWALLAAIGG